MDHCVGEGGYDKLVGGEDLTDDAIWSLRDRDGISILTVRISLGEVDYAKGPSNHEPGRDASMQVRHLVAAFEAAGHPLDVCRGTGIVLLEDGRTFRHDRLPPEVQAEREAAQRQRGRRFPSVHGMSNGRIEGGYLVVDLDGGPHQLIEVASHFAYNPEPVADGLVDGFNLDDDIVTIRFPGGRRIHVPVSGGPTLVSFVTNHGLAVRASLVSPLTIGVDTQQRRPEAGGVSRDACFTALMEMRAGLAAAIGRLIPDVSSYIDEVRRSASTTAPLDQTSPYGTYITPEDVTRARAFNNLTRRFSVLGPGGGGGGAVP